MWTKEDLIELRGAMRYDMRLSRGFKGRSVMYDLEKFALLKGDRLEPSRLYVGKHVCFQLSSFRYDHPVCR